MQHRFPPRSSAREAAQLHEVSVRAGAAPFRNPGTDPPRCHDQRRSSRARLGHGAAGHEEAQMGEEHSEKFGAVHIELARRIDAVCRSFEADCAPGRRFLSKDTWTISPRKWLGRLPRGYRPVFFDRSVPGVRIRLEAAANSVDPPRQLDMHGAEFFAVPSPISASIALRHAPLRCELRADRGIAAIVPGFRKGAAPARTETYATCGLAQRLDLGESGVASQTLRSPSRLAAASTCPSGLKATPIPRPPALETRGPPVP